MIESLSLSFGEKDRFAEIPFSQGARGDLRAGISLKAAGNMRPGLPESRRNREALFCALGLAARRVFACRQVHSRKVLPIRALEAGSHTLLEADGLVTDLQQAVLTVTVADCLPLFIRDKKTGAFGLLHSGWKGTGIATRAIDCMRSLYGSEPKNLEVIVGPGIGSCCYAVDEERYLRFRELFGLESASSRGNRFFLDLRKANLLLLQEMGVEDIRVVRDCTSCNPALASFRRDGPQACVHMLAVLGTFDPYTGAHHE